VEKQKKNRVGGIKGVKILLIRSLFTSPITSLHTVPYLPKYNDVKY
jgi:hypothetical protein